MTINICTPLDWPKSVRKRKWNPRTSRPKHLDAPQHTQHQVSGARQQGEFIQKQPPLLGDEGMHWLSVSMYKQKQSWDCNTEHKYTVLIPSIFYASCCWFFFPPVFCFYFTSDKFYQTSAHKNKYWTTNANRHMWHSLSISSNAASSKRNPVCVLPHEIQSAVSRPCSCKPTPESN